MWHSHKVIWSASSSINAKEIQGIPFVCMPSVIQMAEITARLLTWLVKSSGIKVTHLQWFSRRFHMYRALSTNIHTHRQARVRGLQRIAWILKLDHILCHWTVRISLADRRESSLHLWELTQNILKLWGRNFQERFDQPRHCNWNCASDMTRDQLAWDCQSMLLQESQKPHGLFCQSALCIPYDAERCWTYASESFKWQCKAIPCE